MNNYNPNNYKWNLESPRTIWPLQGFNLVKAVAGLILLGILTGICMGFGISLFGWVCCLVGK